MTLSLAALRWAWPVLLGALMCLAWVTDPPGSAADVVVGFVGVAGVVGISALATLISSRQPGNRIGWLLQVFAVLLPMATVFAGIEPSEPASAWELTAIVFYQWVGVRLVFVVPIFLILFLFPDGHFMNRRWMWGGWLGVIYVPVALLSVLLSDQINGVANPVGFLPSEFADWTKSISVLPILAMAIGGVAAMAVRFRRSSESVRTQIKWVVYAAILAAVGMISIPLGLLGESDLLFGLLFLFVLLVIPAAIAAAITRFRLYEIDRIISRTVSYTVIVALLALVFAAGVVWFPTAFGLEDSPLLVAGTTLLVAALFNPLRRRVQEAVDRRFNRSMYEARLIEERFAAELQNAHSRHELGDAWLETVDEALQPETIGLWLKATRKGQPPPSDNRH